MLVTETQKYVFTSDYSTQRYRYIPLNRVDEIKDITVQEDGKVLASETGTKNNQLWVRWQHPLNPPESHTFVLQYRVVGGLQVQNRESQVYWKAIFADRQAPVRAAKVRMQLPEALAGKAIAFTSFGGPARTDEVDQRTFEFVANQPLQPGEELEVQVRFPSNILNSPTPQW